MTDYDWEMQERKFENDMAAIDLESENAKLRERVAELEELTDDKRYVPQEWYQLATAENKKLRELVRDMFGWYIKNECSNCEYRLDCHELDGACDYMRKFVPSMAELGIEVEQ